MDHEHVDQLRDILGLAVPESELQRLLAQAYGSVQRAVDIHFNGGLEGTVDLATAPPDEAPANSPFRAARDDVAPARSSRRQRPMTTSRRATTTLTDFVELSSSTDNEYDPGNGLWLTGRYNQVSG